MIDMVSRQNSTIKEEKEDDHHVDQDRPMSSFAGNDVDDKEILDSAYCDGDRECYLRRSHSSTTKWANLDNGWRRRGRFARSTTTTTATTTASYKNYEDKRRGGEGSLVVITRPKGGRKALCMDLDEVKACRDLGFELEHDSSFFHTPPSFSTAPASPTSGSSGNSPLSNWHISSPGDDPRDVKARLKIWAHAVAIATSTPRLGS